MISADETIRRADECLDEWRGLDKDRQEFRRSDYERRLADLGYPPDVIARWLDRKRPAGVRKAWAPQQRPVWPRTITA